MRPKLEGVSCFSLLALVTGVGLSREMPALHRFEQIAKQRHPERFGLLSRRERWKIDEHFAFREAEAVLRERLKLRDRVWIECEAGTDAEGEALFVNDDACHVFLKRDRAQLRELDEMFERNGKCAETIADAGGDLFDLRLRTSFGELLVDGDLLRDLRDVLVRNVRADLDVDDGLTLIFERRGHPTAFGDRFG